jgi:YegS/Rv2252/BmrU family lipid kinase
MNTAHPYSKNPILTEILQPKRIIFIVNPKAGTNIQKRIRESVEKYLNHQKFIYGIWHTERAGHAAELTRKAIAEGYEIVVAVGGDGSINEVASALLHTDVVLGIIPAGSGNGLAMHLGYGRILDNAIKKLNQAKPFQMDAGLLNGRPFFNLAGVGYDGRVSNMMKGSPRRGFFPYFLKSVEAGLVHHPCECTVEMENQTFQGKTFAITIANGPMWGYNFMVAPDARIDDGQLEVVILKDAPRWQYFAAVPSTLKGKLYDAEFVEHFTTRKVKITAKGTHFVHVDGEGFQTDGELIFEVLPKALKVLKPQT